MLQVGSHLGQRFLYREIQGLVEFVQKGQAHKIFAFSRARYNVKDVSINGGMKACAISDKAFDGPPVFQHEVD